MNNLIKPTAITLLTTGLLTACVSPATVPHKTPVVTHPSHHTTTVSHHATTVTLALGQQVFVKDQQLNISFDKVANDSRCPAKVQCIWAGNATVTITAMTTTSRPQTLTLSLGDLRGGLSQTQRFANVIITLDSLTSTAAAPQHSPPSTAALPKVQLTIQPVA